MKANNLKALDYQQQDKQLILTLSAVTFEQVATMDTALLRIMTDAGELVEAFAGYRLAHITFNAEKETFTAVLEQGASDTTAQSLDALTKALAAAETQLIDTQLAVCDVFEMLAGGEI